MWACANLGQVSDLLYNKIIKDVNFCILYLKGVTLTTFFASSLPMLSPIAI